MQNPHDIGPGKWWMKNPGTAIVERAEGELWYGVICTTAHPDWVAHYWDANGESTVHSRFNLDGRRCV